MAQKKSLIGSGEYTRIYENMKGVNFSEQGADSARRFAHLENLYIDYEGGGALESVPGFRVIANLGGRINGIFSQNHGGEEFLIVHAAESVFRFNIKDRDSLGQPSPIFTGMADRKSTAVSFGDLLYILDGENIVAVNQRGEVLRCGDAGAEPYIPTTHTDGKALEPRNLLTPHFIQKLRLKRADEHAFGTKGIRYAITDYDGKICAVDSATDEVCGEVYIPSFATVGGVRYKVTRIFDSAFAGNTRITALITGANLEVIGNAAFSGCTSLKRVILSRTLRTVGSECFKGCTALSYLHVGESIQKFGSSSFDLCTSLKSVDYAKGIDEYELVENRAVFEDRPVHFNVPCKHIRMSIPVEGRVDSISSVTFDGEEVDFSFTSGDDAVTVDHPNRELVEGREVILRGRFAPEEGVVNAANGDLLTPEECIFGCTLAAIFDGRIFLSGNSRLPGIVFYSGHGESGAHPFYFSAGGYISDGAGGSPVTSLLSRGDGLFVFKRGDDGEGNIFFHTAEGTDAERRYPVSYFHRCGGRVGAAISFMGDPIFLSSIGACTPIRDASRDFVGISCRSGNIAKRLSAEELSDTRLEIWRGYLVISSGGRVYLGDSRSVYRNGDDIAYEWYFMNGIGSYLADSRVYYYSATPKSGFLLSPTPDERVAATVYSAGDGHGGLNYFTYEQGGRVAVYPSEERRGGKFFPATEIKCLGDLFFFGTECGALCLFNNDKRGVPPPYVAASADFSAEEYERSMGRSIHPYYYSFADHPIEYALATPPDDCELPYLEKSTVRASAVLKLRCPLSCEAQLSVRTDGELLHVGRIRTSRLDFSSLCFSDMSLCTSDGTATVVNEQTKGWSEKQYFLTSSGFRAPIGFCSLSFRYRIKGRIKNR